MKGGMPAQRHGHGKSKTAQNTNWPHFQTPFGKGSMPLRKAPLCSLSNLFARARVFFQGTKSLLQRWWKILSTFFKQIWNCFAEDKQKYSQWVVSLPLLSSLWLVLRTRRHFKGIGLEKTKLGGDNRKNKSVFTYVLQFSQVCSQIIGTCLPLPQLLGPPALPPSRVPHTWHSWYQVSSLQSPAWTIPLSIPSPQREEGQLAETAQCVVQL